MINSARSANLFAQIVKKNLPTFSNQQQKANLSLLMKPWGKTVNSSSSNLQNIANRKLPTAAAPLIQVKEEESVTICRPCEAHDRQVMIDFMNQLFVTREPLMKNLGATPQNSRKYVSYCIDEALEQGVSYIAIDGESGETCGLRLNAIGPSSGNELKVDFGPNINAIPQFLYYIEEGTEKLLGTDKYMRHVAICVKPSATQCGIATDLMSLSVRCAVERNLSHMVAMCSWRLPYKLANKMGYTLSRELAYVDYANLVGEAPRDAFLKLADSEEKARIMVKKIT